MTELVDKYIKIGMWGIAHPPIEMATEESMSMKRTDMEDKKKTQLQVSDEKLLRWENTWWDQKWDYTMQKKT